jgi:hypothetical protein
MAQFRRLRLIGASALLFLALLAQGCSRPVAMRSSDDAAPPEANDVPFTRVDDKADVTAGNQRGSALVGASKNLPVGTMLTVRLKDPVWTDAPDASGTFEAIVDEAITVEGITLISRGANVSGRVESAGASTIKSNRNYVRLTLDSISLGGRDFPIQTSSLFARGQASISASDAPGDSLAVIHLDKGRRLTFRLTEPVYVASQKPLSTP